MARIRYGRFSALPFLAVLLLLLLLLFLSSSTGARTLGGGQWNSTAPLSYLRLPVAAEEACEQTYGVLPCTRSVVGNLFLLVVYGYLMLTAARHLSNGSEMLLDILGPGIVGGLCLPMLGALPDAILILVSGLSGSRETAQKQVLIGMGLLSGSTVMLLTVLWGSCIFVGKCNLSGDSNSIDLQDTRGFSLFGSGISTDIQTSYAARIMVVSVIPFVIVQFPKIFRPSDNKEWIVLIALALSLALLFAYCFYQIYQPWILKRRLEYAKLKCVISGFLRYAHERKPGFGRLLREDGRVDEFAIEKLFRTVDIDSNNVISRSELTALLLGINFDGLNFGGDDAVDQLMKDFDTSHDGKIDLVEFIAGMKRWLNEAKHTVGYSNKYGEFVKYFHEQTREEHSMLLEGNGHEDDNENDVEDGNTDSPSWIWVKAISLLLLGTAMAAIFADPLVDVVDNFSSATHIPSFFISFIAMPLATNSSEAVSAIIFASRKKQKTASLTFSEIYGAATMNNTLCLSVFLSLVYVRHLTWDFSSEVLIILLVCIIMGLFASFRTSFPLWTSLIAFLLYPLSLILVFVLDNFYGWT